jgi:hypothetical protein
MRKEDRMGPYENMEGAILQGADLEGTDLRYARIRGADLRDVNLVDAVLRGANLMDADLRNANLYGANLEGTALRGARLDGATMPDGRKWEAYRQDPLAGIFRSPEARERAVRDWKRNGSPDFRGKDRIAVAAFIAVHDAGLLDWPE